MVMTEQNKQDTVHITDYIEAFKTDESRKKMLEIFFDTYQVNITYADNLVLEYNGIDNDPIVKTGKRLREYALVEVLEKKAGKVVAHNVFELNDDKQADNLDKNIFGFIAVEFIEETIKKLEEQGDTNE